MIDHRSTLGVSAEAVALVGLPVGAGSGLFEAPTFTCSHCPRIVVLHPMRTRERGHCVKCDHYICDSCEAIRVATGVCRPFKQQAEELQEALAKASLIKEI